MVQGVYPPPPLSGSTTKKNHSTFYVCSLTHSCCFRLIPGRDRDRVRACWGHGTRRRDVDARRCPGQTQSDLRSN